MIQMLGMHFVSSIDLLCVKCKYYTCILLAYLLGLCLRRCALGGYCSRVAIMSFGWLWDVCQIMQC